MFIRGATQSEIQASASAAGVDVRNLRPVGRGWRFVLRPRPGGRWQRTGAKQRRVYAVCWHGHERFLCELFWRAPAAMVATMMARLDGIGALDVLLDAANSGADARFDGYRRACFCG